MEYSLTLTLPGSPELIFARYVDHTQWTHWQAGLVEVVPVSGTVGEPGAETTLRFEFPGHSMTMTETLGAVIAPERREAVYRSGPVTNWCSDHFEAVGDETEWTQTNAWAFDGADPDEADEERFRATTLAGMQAFARFCAEQRG